MVPYKENFKQADDGNFYHLHDYKKEWEDARTICKQEQKGSRLAIIEDEISLEAMKKIVGIPGKQWETVVMRSNRAKSRAGGKGQWCKKLTKHLGWGSDAKTANKYQKKKNSVMNQPTDQRDG